jgi:hypothetical protein
MALELLLFTNRVGLARQSLAGGAAGVVIDWERAGKIARQAEADTLVSADLPEDLERMCGAVTAPVICRLDTVGPWTPDQLELAVGLGADEVMLPMVRGPEEVMSALSLAAGRCGVGILVETVDAMANREALAALPVSRVYVGLNDLAIERRTPSIFTALVDGTLDMLRRTFADMPFGVGGATIPEGGHPIPARLLIAELVRLRTDFTFLRRSFWRDVAGRDAAGAVRSIRRAAAVAGRRNAPEALRDHAELVRAVRKLSRVSGAPRPVASGLSLPTV